MYWGGSCRRILTYLLKKLPLQLPAATDDSGAKREQEVGEHGAQQHAQANPDAAPPDCEEDLVNEPPVLPASIEEAVAELEQEVGERGAQQRRQGCPEVVPHDCEEDDVPKGGVLFN